MHMIGDLIKYVASEKRDLGMSPFPLPETPEHLPSRMSSVIWCALRNAEV
jgi:hypothetical protein